MKITIIVLLIAVMLPTPCFAQEVEPNGIFSVEGTLWRVCAIALASSEEPHLSIDCDDTVGFYQGKAYINSAHSAFSWWHDEVSYTDLGVVSITWGHCSSLVCYYLAIIQPTIGFGALTYGELSCYFNIINGEIGCASKYVIGIMYKVDDDWASPGVE